MTHRRNLFLAFTVVSAVAAFAAFPPLDVGPLAWFALVPLLLALGQMTPRQGFWHGWLFGLLFVGGTMSFVAKFGFLPWFVLSVAMGLFYAVFGLVAATLRKSFPLLRVPALAATWTLLEMLRGNLGPLSLTFGDFAYSQHLQLPLIQFASVAGHYGVGFLMALLSSGVATVILAMLPFVWYRPGDAVLFNRQAGRVAIACFFILFANHFIGMSTISGGDKKLKALATTPVATVQAEGKTWPRGRGPSTDDTVRAYIDQTMQLPPSQLIVWPETAVPESLNLDRLTMRRVKDLAIERGAHLLIGASEDRDGSIYNSAYHFRPDGAVDGIYRKMDLVVFGEYVPWRDQISFFERYPIRPFDYTSGAGRKVFDLDGFRFAPLICFEGIFPRQAREVTRLGAQLVVIITSDEWALHTNEVQQHSHITVFRAIESRRYVIRSATNGRSAIYDPLGQILSSVGYYENGTATANIAPLSRLSLYHRVGDWPLLIICLALLALGLRRSLAYTP